jgi:16S rRNA G527 N7-methylase RsmG
VFLREALKQLGLESTVIAKPFEDIDPPAVSFVTCRALDEFIAKLPAIIRWAPRGSKLLLFGGESLREKLGERIQEFKIPLSERRFLFVTTKQTD